MDCRGVGGGSGVAEGIAAPPPTEPLLCVTTMEKGRVVRPHEDSSCCSSQRAKMVWRVEDTAVRWAGRIQGARRSRPRR